MKSNKEKLKISVLNLYNGGTRVTDIVPKPVYHEAPYTIG